MRFKVMVVAVVLLLLCAQVVMAEVPSIFEVNLLNYYSLKDISEGSYAAYTPGLRAALFITSWFGMSADVVMPTPFDLDGGDYSFLLNTDLIFRWPLGFFEMYGAIGPSYEVTYDQTNATLQPFVKYNGRVGFDFNLTPIFSVGVEGVYLFNDLSSLIDGTSELNPLSDTLIGIGLKVKL